MSDLTPEIADEVVAACQAGAEEAASALSRALDGEFQFSPGEAVSFDASQLPESWEGPGLAIVLRFGEVGAVALLPQSTGLLPDWCSAPDATGESKLSTLAQELSMLLVPESLMADEFQAVWVDHLATAIERGEAAEKAMLLPLDLTAGDSQGPMTLLWPVNQPANVIPAPSVDPEEATTESTEESNTPPAPAAETNVSAVVTSKLPDYTRSLLKISVPVTVNLATKKQSVREIIELGQGAILKFEKPCEEMLTLSVGDQEIAEGEVVKVGENFGLRIHTMLLPAEHFLPT